MTLEITNLAVETVKQNNIKDYENVILFAEKWVKIQMKNFTSENLKQDYYLSGNSQPGEPRLFGAIFRKLSKEGSIFKNGFELSKNPVCHSRPQQVWISKEFRLKQQSNSIKNKNQIEIFVSS